MRLSPSLNAQHIGRLIKKIWHIKARIKVSHSRAEEFLTKNNIKVYKLEDLEPPKPQLIKEESPLIPKEVVLDESHPDWKKEPCYIYHDNELLVEGADQARALIKCEEISDIPMSIKHIESNLTLDDELHEEAKKKIMHSCIFDPTQEKLPKRNDPLRPAFFYPLDYGITDVKKNQLLLRNLVQLCDQHVQGFDKNIVENAYFSTVAKVFGKQLKFEATGDVVVRSCNNLPGQIDESLDIKRKEVPDLKPIDPTVGLLPSNIYTSENIYPFIAPTKFPFVHTAFLSFNRTEVKNIYEEPVTESQIIGRNIMKGFCMAASQVRDQFGMVITELINPVVVQLIMTEGRFFYFSVLQINTLNVDNNNCPLKNIYWNSPPMALYERCQMDKGKPILEGYNGDVLKRIIAFYKNK